VPYYGTLRWSQWKLPYIVVLFRLQRTKHHGDDHPIARFAPGERVRDAKSSLGLWYVVLPRGSRRVSEAILFGRGIRNSECNSVKQNRTLSDLKQKSFARSSRGCPITGSRVFILESPSWGHLFPGSRLGRVGVDIAIRKYFLDIGTRQNLQFYLLTRRRNPMKRQQERNFVM
jgi:hypothetical protein